MTDRTPTTSETLLRELAAHPDSPRAEEFARLYEPVLRRYVAQSCVGNEPIQPADRDDLVQEIYLSVRSALPGFRYDRSRGRFRDYLRRAVRNAVLRFRRNGMSTPLPLAETVPASVPDASGELLPQIWTLALVRVLRSGAFSPNTMAAFRRAVLENAPIPDVAREFKLKPNALYQIKNRVLRAVRAELDRFGRGRLSPEELLEALLAAEREGR